jgi:hypothetical protein
MIMRKRFFAFMCTVCLLLASAHAMATPVVVGVGNSNSWVMGAGWGNDISETYSICEPLSGFCYTFVGGTLLGASFSINPSAGSAGHTLASGESFQFIFGSVYLNSTEDYISDPEKDNLDIMAKVDLKLPGIDLITITGQGTAIGGLVSDAPYGGKWVWVPKYWFYPGPCDEAHQYLCSQEWVPPTGDVTISFLPESFAYGDGTITVGLSDIQIFDKGLEHGKTVYATVSYNETAPIPEPTSMMLLGFGLVGVMVARRKFQV